MENAAQALKTAAAVLIFIIAITVAFTMFSRAKATTDTIIKSQDEQEYLEAAVESVKDVVLTDKTKIPIEDIKNIRGNIFDIIKTKEV